jgi:5-deoxy-glucuronate isomerase
MPKFIRAYDNQNAPIIAGDRGDAPTSLIYFNLVRLAAGQAHTYSVPGFETVNVVLSGRCDIKVGSTQFAGIGQRQDVWSGKADSVYAPPGAEITFTALADATEIAVAGGRCDVIHAPYRITPDEVDVVEVGSVATKSRRRIFHVLGANGTGRAGNLLVSELLCDDGCWSGYPPHKHDTDRDGESDHEEAYHYRFRPQSGFGAQFSYFDGIEDPRVHMTRTGDTFVIDKGYHPTVTSPGHEEYVFTILVGRTRRPLIQWFEQQHRHLMDKIPGIADMQRKFLA